MKRRPWIHICTGASFAVGAPRYFGVCQVCCRRSKLYAGWLGQYCGRCGYTVSSEDWVGVIAKWRREYLEMSREQVAKRLGLLPSTISYYETKRCSKRYFKKMEELVKERGDDNSRSDKKSKAYQAK